ncbi:MAG: hypothetical protein GY820_47170 [Gammaproteobacteria bacterium]|nr:hypothetical protein [Gammaproteobacteria bacterium]
MKRSFSMKFEVEAHKTHSVVQTGTLIPTSDEGLIPIPLILQITKSNGFTLTVITTVFNKVGIPLFRVLYN